MNQGVVEVCDRALYDLTRERAPTANGPLDPLMGLSGKVGLCQTCGEPMQKCNGHFGYVRLALPALHIGYFKKIVMVLQNICKVYNMPNEKIWRLMFARGAQGCFSRRLNDELSFETCGDQISITYGRLRFAKKSMTNAARLDPVITAVTSTDGSRRPGHIL